MAWNAPVGASAPYQPAPQHASGQAGYTQQYPPQQYGQQPNFAPQYPAKSQYPQNGPPHHGPSEHRPPKKKGNPVITRYPPPPGYRGPAHPHGPPNPNPYQAQYQAPLQQAYQTGYAGQPNYQQNPSYPAHSGYPQTQGYPQSQAYSPQGYVPPQNPYQQPPNYPQTSYQQPAPTYPQYPPQAYPPNQAYPQAPQAPVAPNPQYPPQQAGYQPYQPYAAPPTAPVDPNQPAYAPAQSWQTANAQPVYPPQNAYNAYAAPVLAPNVPDPNTAVSVPPAPVNAVQEQQAGAEVNAEQASGQKPDLYLGHDDNFDFDGPIWPKGNEPVDTSLSLGVIIWRPAKQATRALPSNYEEAEKQALRKAPEKLGNGESVSKYFTLKNSYKAFLDVRETDEWKKIKNDPIFVKFPPEKDMDLIPIEQCIAERDRPDVPVEEEPQEEDDEEMPDANWNVMDNLEQALSGGQDGDTKSASKESTPVPSSTEHITRNQEQEDVLAMLGVTGTPKPATNETIAVSLPSLNESPANTKQAPRPHVDTAPQRANTYAGHPKSRNGPPQQRPYGSMSSVSHQRPPPSINCRSSNFERLNSQERPNGHVAFDGARESPARSEGSNHTPAGSDFETQSKAASAANVKPQPRLQRNSSSSGLKRSYDETDQDDENVRKQDDHAPRYKRRQPQVASAYSRR